MNHAARNVVAGLFAVLVLGGCAPTYSPPPEHRSSERCPIGEVSVCTDRYPSRLERENDIPPICRCERPERIY